MLFPMTLDNSQTSWFLEMLATYPLEFCSEDEIVKIGVLKAKLVPGYIIFDEWEREFLFTAVKMADAMTPEELEVLYDLNAKFGKLRNEIIYDNQ